MERGLKIAIAVAALVIVVLLGRRAIGAMSEVDVTGPAEPFAYAAVDRSLSAIGPDLRSLGGVLDIARDRHGRACEGDAEAMRTIRERVDEVLAAGEPREGVRDAMTILAQHCFDPSVDTGFCDWARAEIDDSGALADVAWSVLATCPSGAATPYFDRVEAPAEDVLGFVAHRAAGVAAAEPPARLPSQYARAVIEIASRPSVPLAGDPASVLAIRYEDAATAATLLAAYESAPDAERRHAVGRALGVLSDARARAAYEATCVEEHPLTPTVCTVPDALEGMHRMLDAASYVARHPSERERVVHQLETCAAGEGDTTFASLCLRDVAELDWERARVIADRGGSAFGAAVDPGVEALGRTLRRYPSADAMMVALRSRGLLGEPRPMSRPPVTAGQTLVAYGRGWSLENTSTMDGHDRLARHLARLVTPTLDDVVFDEILPDGGEVLIAMPEMELVAYARSERFAVMTASDGDYYDLGAVIGLLNMLLRERRSDLRYLTVEDPFVVELVVVGTEAALLSAIADDVLVAVDPTELGL